MVKVNKISSNIVGLAIAKEESYGVLPAAPLWYKMEPNTYGDTGATIATTAPNPISDTRQRRKGVVTDLDATAGFNHDLNAENMKELFQGFLFADTDDHFISYDCFTPVSGESYSITLNSSPNQIEISGTKITTANIPSVFNDESRIRISGFTGTAASNNDDYLVASTNGRVISLTTITGTPVTLLPGDSGDATNAKIATLESTSITNCYEAPLGGLKVSIDGDSYILESAASPKFDFNQRNIKAGDWIFIGGDNDKKFLNQQNNGFKRVLEVIPSSANEDISNSIRIDKTGKEMIVETSTTIVNIFFGDTLSNSTTGRGITRRTYTIERTLGQLEDTSDPSDETKQCEIITGSVPNEMSINFPANGLMNVDVGFVAKDQELMSGMADFMQNTTGTITGDHLNQPIFNTVSDVSRMRLTSLDTLGEELFGFVTEASITINNNVTPDKALGTLGAFDVTTGNFTVGGTVQAYFSDVNAIKAIRENADVTIDYVLVTNNKGIVFDLPLITLGDGRLNVEEGQSISLPLNTEAARSSFGYTMKIVFFPYLPNLADEM